MIGIDTSVILKWFKTGEPHEAQAQELRQRVERREVQAVVCELLGLEVIRGLKKAQTNQPALGILDAHIGDAWNILESMVQTGNLQQCRVEPVGPLAKDLILLLNLTVVDALHLATAIHRGAEYFVTEDQYLLKPAVVNHAARLGVKAVDLPGCIAALNASAAGPSSPTP